MRPRPSTDPLELALAALFPPRVPQRVSFTLWSINGHVPTLVKNWSGGHIWLHPLEFNRRLNVGENDGVVLTGPRLNSLLSRYIHMSDPRIARFSRPDQLLFLQYQQIQRVTARVDTIFRLDCFDALAALYPNAKHADAWGSRRPDRSQVVRELRQTFIAMLRVLMNAKLGSEDPAFMRVYLPAHFY